LAHLAAGGGAGASGGGTAGTAGTGPAPKAGAVGTAKTSSPRDGTTRAPGLEGERPGGNSFRGDSTAGLCLPTTGSTEGPLAVGCLAVEAGLETTTSATGAGAIGTGRRDCLSNKGVGVKDLDRKTGVMGDAVTSGLGNVGVDKEAKG